MTIQIKAEDFEWLVKQAKLVEYYKIHFKVATKTLDELSSKYSKVDISVIEGIMQSIKDDVAFKEKHFTFM